MNQEELASHKFNYKSIHVPSHIVEQKWLTQQHVLGEQELPRPLYYRALPYAFAFAGVVLFLTASLFIVQASKPGDSLYGMKALTRQVYSELTKPFSSDNGTTAATMSAHIAPPTTIPAKNLALPTITLHPTSQEEMHESTTAKEHEHETEVKGVAVTGAPHASAVPTSSHQNESDNHGNQSENNSHSGSGSQNSHDTTSDHGNQSNSHNDH